jgi:hypothetical protein
MHSRHRWAVHTDVAATVDLLLRGQLPLVQQRELTVDGSVQLVDPPEPNRPRRPVLAAVPMPRPDALRPDGSPSSSASLPEDVVSSDDLQVFCCGLSVANVEQAVRRRCWPVQVVEDLGEADVVLSVRQGLGREPRVRRQARDLRVPILVIKSDTLAQIERALERLLSRRADSPETGADARDDHDDELAGLEECRLAVEQVVMPEGRPVELLPRSERVRQMQADLVSRYRLRSDVFGQEGTCRLRVFPP